MASFTRRQLAFALAAAPCALPAQQPSAPATVASKDLTAAREQYRKHSVKLAAINIPMATEPAFRFKA